MCCLFASLAILTGCGGGGGDSGDIISESGGTIPISTSSEVPENLVSFEDPSITVDAVARGLDPDFDLLRTQFFCYLSHDANGNPIVDFTEPEAIIEFTGNTFT